MSKIWDAIKRVERERTPGGAEAPVRPGWQELVHAKESRLRSTGEPAGGVHLSPGDLRAELQPELEHQRQRAVNAESQLQYLEAILRETKAQLEEQQASYAALQEASAGTEQRLAAELHARDEQIQHLQEAPVAGQRKERGRRTAPGGGKLAQVEFQLAAERERANSAEANLRGVETKFRQTQAELAEQRATCAHMEKGIEQSEKDLVAEVMRRDREISRLKDLAADGDRLRLEADEGRSQIATLEKALRKVRSELDTQLAARADLDEKSRQAQTTQAELRRLRSVAEKACTDLESERTARAKQQADAQRAVEELAGQAAAYQKEMARLQAALKDAQKETQQRDRDIASRVAKAESLLATQGQRATKAESKLQRLGSAVREAQAALDAERASHAELQAAFRATQHEHRHALESRDRDNVRLQDLLRKVREDARETHDKFEARFAQATAAEDAARAEAAETAAQLKDLRRVLCAKQRDFDALQAARDKLEVTAQAAQQKLAEEAKRRAAKIISLDNALKEAKVLAREKHRGIEKEFKEAQQRARNEQSRATRAEGEANQLRTSLAAVERDLAAQRARSSELQQAWRIAEKKLTSDIEKRDREIARYHASSTAAREQIERDRAQIETRLAEAEAALADGRERLAEKTTKVKRLQARCKALEQHLAQPGSQPRVVGERGEQSDSIRPRSNGRGDGAVRVARKDEAAARQQVGPRISRTIRAPSEHTPRRPTAAEVRQPAAAPAGPPPRTTAHPEKSLASVTAQFRIVAIGGSIGGPGAVAEIIGAMPGDVPACVLVVQHLPQGYTTEWAHSLNRQANIVVVEARNGDVLLPGRALIAPGGFHLKIEDGRVHLTDGPRVNSHRPSISVLFDSLLPVADRAHAVLLSGMGEDGVAAMEHLHTAGAETLVQDRASSVLWGMAGAAVEAGAVAAKLAPKPLAQYLVRSVMERAGPARRTKRDAS